MMTKRDFEAIAEAISDEFNAIDPANGITNSNYILGKAAGMGFLAERLATVFESKNPRFDREKFLTACFDK